MFNKYIFSDSSLPVGSFILSHGLEYKYSLGLVRTVTELKEFILETCHNLQSSTWPFMAQTYKLLDTSSNILMDIMLLDCEIDTFYCCNSISFASSKISGTGYITCILKSGISSEEWIKEYRRCILKEDTSGNFPISFAVMGYYLKLDLQELKFQLLLTTVKNLISAAVRLNIINSFTGLKMTLDFKDEIQTLSLVKTPSRYCNTSPLLDIYQGRQEYLYSKLFHS